MRVVFASSMLVLSSGAAWLPSGELFAQDAVPIRSLRDGVFDMEQVEEGKALYEVYCLHCHQPEQFAGEAFMQAWEGQPVEALLRLIRSTMPEDNPGRLNEREYVAVLAFLFHLNGLPVGEEKLPAGGRRLQAIRIEPADKRQE